jgi:hypothetical protein
MKFFYGILFTIFLVSSAFTKHKTTKFKHIDITLTSNQGCIVHIVGELNFTMLPPKISSFNGTVTIGGPKGCPTGVLTFGTVNKGLSVRFDNESVCAVTLAEWRGSNETVVNLLNEKELVKGLVATINQLCG